MDETKGIGLAAPQVGWHERVLAINLSGQKRDGLIFLNPVIVQMRGKKFAAHEACLSVPGIAGLVERPSQVVVDAMNMNGEVNRFELDGLLARCFMHEFDHLDGILFIDRLSPAKKQAIKKKLRRLGGPE